METVRHLPLAAPVAAALAGELVWVADRGGSLRPHRLDGSLAGPPVAVGRVATLAGTAEHLVSVEEQRELVVRDPSDGSARGREHLDDPLVVAGGGTVWVVDRAVGRAGQLTAGAAVTWVSAVGAVAGLAAEGARCWWSESGRSIVHATDGTRIELGTAGEPAGAAMAVCAGSLWIAATGELVRVGTWRAELGLPVHTGLERPLVLGCAGGRLLGASRSAVFVLDPRRDEDVRVVATTPPGEPLAAFGTAEAGWVVGTEGALLISG